MSLENTIYSKHFIYKQNLFSTSKRLLTLRFSGISLDSLPYAASSYETIDFSEISKLEVPDRNDKDLILHYKKKSQPLTFDFSCYNRPQFLLEFYKAQDLYKCFKKSYKDLFEISGLQVFCEKEQEEVRLELTRTCLRLHYLRKAQEDNMLREFLDIKPSEVGGQRKSQKNQEIIDFLINLTQIKAIFRQENGFLVMLNQSETLMSFQFTEEQMKRVDFFLEELRSNNEDYCKGFPLIEFSNKPIELKLSFKTLQSFIMREKAYKLSMSKAKRELITIAFNDESFFEIGVESQNLINKMPLNSVIAITRQDFPENTGFSLVFTDKTIEEYHLNGFTRDTVISNLQYLITLRKPDVFTVDFLQGKGAWESRRELKVEGFLNNEPDPEYEADVMRRILTPKREENFNEILKEFTLNLTLRKFEFADNKVLVFLIEKFLSFLSVFNNPEFSEMTEVLQRVSMGMNSDLSEKIEKNSEIQRKNEEILRKLETIKRNLPLKVNNLSVDLNNHGQICYFIEEILKALTILVTNRGFFREFSTNKKEVLYEKFLIQLLTLLKGPHPVLSYLGFTFLKYLSNHPDQKSECLNKYHLFNTQSLDIPSQFSSFLLEKLLKCSVAPSETLALIGCLKTLKSWIKDKKESTQPEDLERLLRKLSVHESITPVLNSLSTENFELFSKASQLILCMFDWKGGARLPKTLFESSVFFLVYFRAALLLKNTHLRGLAIAVIGKTLVDNGEACSLLVRLVPKNMISLVKTGNADLSKWGEELWEQFFEILGRDHNNASEVWDSFARNELIRKLEAVERGFLRRFREIVAAGIRNRERSSMVVAGGGENVKLLVDKPKRPGDGSSERGKLDFLSILRFNHQDLSIEYTSLRSYCLVGRYYLTHLLKSDVPPSNPRLSTNITHVYRFWTELNFGFLSRENPVEKSLILKIMILVARDYFRDIKEFNSMGYFLNMLLERTGEFQYLTLQLLYTSLTREDSKANVRLFLGFEGVDKLFLLLARIICGTEDREEDEEFDYTDGGFAQKVCRKLSDKRQNSCLFILEIIKALLSSERTEEFSLEEADEDAEKELFESRTPDFELFPVKSLKEHLKNPIYIEILCDCFLCETPSIWLSVLEILRRELISRELMPFFQSFKGFFDLLMLRFNKLTFQPILDIVLLLKKLILEISRNSSQINYFRFYSHFSFDEMAEATIHKAVDFFGFMKFFPKAMLRTLFSGKPMEFLAIYQSDCYEVPDLIWTREMRQFLENTLFSETLRHRKKLIEYAETRAWGFEDGRRVPEDPVRGVENSKNTENTVILPFENPESRDSAFFQEPPTWSFRLIESSPLMKSPIKSRLDAVPRYETSVVMPISFLQLEKEVTCGPLFLRVWNRKEFKGFEVETGNIEKFLRLLEQKMMGLMREIKADSKGFIQFQEELYQMILGLSKALKRYRIRNYSNFEETFDIIEHFAREDEGVRFRLVGVRAVYRAIEIENSGNLEGFIRKKGIFVIFDAFSKEVERIFAGQNKQMVIEEKTIKLLAKILAILVLVMERKKEEFIALETNVLKTFFSNLQKISLMIMRFLNLLSLPDSQLDWFFSGATSPTFPSIFSLSLLPIFSKFLLLISLESPLSSPLIESGVGFLALTVCLFPPKPIPDTLPFIQSMALLLRNLAVWSYESYILSNNSGAKKLELPSNSRKTTMVFLNIHKLSKQEKERLSLFYEDLYSLVLKPNLIVLLKDYQEPGILNTPGQIEFLEFFNRDCESLTFVWKPEMRVDLRELIAGVLERKALEGKFFDEKELAGLREYRYASLLNELIIEDTIICVFNSSPETQKLTNFGFFVKLLFGTIRDHWQAIEENRPFDSGLTNEKRLKGSIYIYFRRIRQALEALAHILRLQQLDTLFLEKHHFTVLVKSLLLGQVPPENLTRNCDKVIVAEGLNNVQRDVFFMFSKLTMVKEGIMALLQNKGAIVGLVRGFRANSEALKALMFETLRNMSLQSYLFRFLAKYGFIGLFLEFVLKSDVFSLDFRAQAFDYLLTFYKDKDHDFHSIIDTLFSSFPLMLRELIIHSSKFLDSLDKELLSFTEFWTPRMRKELWMLWKSRNDKIQTFLEAFDTEFISLDAEVLDYNEKPSFDLKFPEVKEEIAIEGVFLRSFIKNPVGLDINKSFISKLLVQTEAVLIDYASSLKSEGLSEKTNRLLAEGLLVTCSVLLALEQVLLREPQAFKGSEEDFIGKWLEMVRMEGIHGHLRIMLFQIALISEEIEMKVSTEMEIVRICSLCIGEFGEEMTKQMGENEGDMEGEGYRFIEEIILMQLLLKCMLRDRKTLGMVHSKILPILLMYLEQGENKSYLDTIIMCILAMLVKDLEFAESTLEILSKKPYINVEQDFEKIRPRDYDFKCLWRGFNEKCDFSSHLEKTFGYYSSENSVIDFALPVISENVLIQLPIYNEEVKKELAEIEEFVMKEIYDSQQNQ